MPRPELPENKRKINLTIKLAPWQIELLRKYSIKTNTSQGVLVGLALAEQYGLVKKEGQT